ncbi:sugar transferase [Nocardia sp. R16R-3T]
MAAEFIKDYSKGRDLAQVVSDDWWRETILFYIAGSDATPVVAACLAYAKSAPADKSTASVLTLAVQCADDARELSVELQDAVNAMQSPPDIMTNHDARRIAARTRLLLRANREKRILPGVYASDPITKWEYLYFLESTDHPTDRVPDHWRGKSDFRSGGDEPITGLRHEDAADFCNWLGTELETQDLYRLPTVHELSEGVWPGGSDPSPSWTYDRLGNTNDDLASTILGNNVLHEYIPFPDITDPQLRHAFRNSIDSDSMDLLAMINHQVDGHVLFDFRNGLGERYPVKLPSNASAEAAEALYSRAGDSIHCDGGQIEHKCVYLKTLLHQTMQIAMGQEPLGASTLPPTWSIDEGLPKVGSRLSNDISRLAALTFSRSHPGGGESTSAIQTRIKRLRYALILFAAFVRTTLAAMDASADKPPKFPRRHLSLRATKDRRLICIASLHILLKTAREIYCSCVTLELRVSEKIQATETLRYVRVPGTDKAGTEVQSTIHPPSRFQRIAKRFFDLTFACAAFFAILPVLLIIAVAIKVSSRGPAFHLSERVGLNGIPFDLIRFRTMYMDADAIVNRALNEFDSPIFFKMRDDPRVTPIGRLLRRYSFDELPQFFNVIKGDMSVVGPRPCLAHEVAAFDGKQLRQLIVKPGITGLWQVSGRSDLSEASSMRLDLSYVENFSMGQDLRLIARTVRAVTQGEGKY